MLYYSEVRNRKVFTDDEAFVGQVEDLVFAFADSARVTKLYVKIDPLKTFAYVPIDDVILFGDKIILKKKYRSFELDENELYIGKNVVDKQIIDIEGKKVVRANDAILQVKDQKSIFVVGVEVGILSVLRWIGLEKPTTIVAKFFGIELQNNVLEWNSVQPLELSRGKVVLDIQHDRLEKFLPEDLADYLEMTNIRNAIQTLDLLDEKYASEVIAELDLKYQIALFEKFEFEKTAQIIQLMDPDEVVDVLLHFDPKMRADTLRALPDKSKNEIKLLMAVSSTQVGKYMTSEFLTVHRSDKVSSVLKKIREETSTFDFLFYVYVLNNNDKLVGVVNVHELLLHKGSVQVDRIMQSTVVLAHLNTPIRTVVKRLITYKLHGLPVIDKDRQVIGVVLLDDIDDLLLQQLEMV